MDILDLKPFETCSIRPQTENTSLTFNVISDEILALLVPFIRNGSIGFISMSDDDLKSSILLVRSRLMP